MDSIHDAFNWHSPNSWHFCRFCKHLHNLHGHLTCDAFPEGIPNEILSKMLLHDKPIPGQKNDIVFTSKYNEYN